MSKTRFKPKSIKSSMTKWKKNANDYWSNSKKKSVARKPKPKTAWNKKCDKNKRNTPKTRKPKWPTTKSNYPKALTKPLKSANWHAKKPYCKNNASTRFKPKDPATATFPENTTAEPACSKSSF